MTIDPPAPQYRQSNCLGTCPTALGRSHWWQRTERSSIFDSWRTDGLRLGGTQSVQGLSFLRVARRWHRPVFEEAGLGEFRAVLSESVCRWILAICRLVAIGFARFH